MPYPSPTGTYCKNVPVQLCMYQILLLLFTLPSSRFKETSNRHFSRLNVLFSDLCQLVLSSLHEKLLVKDRPITYCTSIVSFLANTAQEILYFMGSDSEK